MSMSNAALPSYFLGKPESYIARADCYLLVDEQEFPVHASLLECQSPVIHELLEIVREGACSQTLSHSSSLLLSGSDSGSATHINNNSNKGVLPLRIQLFPKLSTEQGSEQHPGAAGMKDPELFEAFLQVVYKPSTPLKDKNQIVKLLELGELLQCDDIKNICDRSLANLAMKDGLTYDRGTTMWDKTYWELAVRHRMPSLGAQYLSSYLKDVLLRSNALKEVELDAAAQHALLLEISKLNIINFVREYRPHYSPDVAGIEGILHEAWK